MIDDTFVQAVVNLVKEPKTFEMPNGETRLVLPHGWSDGTPDPPMVKAIQLGTLSGIADYVNANPEGLEGGTFMLSIEGPTKVSVVGVHEGEASGYRRNVYASAVRRTKAEPSLQNFMDPEAFIITLTTHFEPSPERDALVALASSIEGSDVRTSEDDGFSQQVGVRRGVKTSMALVKNPVTLAPYRTFPEISPQPESKFIVRFRGGGDQMKAALFLSDGDKWETKAVDAIHAWLLAATPKVPILR